MISPRACGSQCGAPSPVSAGTNTTPSAVRHGRGDGRRLGGRADDLESVAQPLHGGAGHEDRTLERVDERAVGAAPGSRRQQACVGADQGRAGVGQDERPGAVGALRVAHVEARLAEQRRLLVARDPGDRQAQVEERLGVGRGDLTPVRDQLRQRVRAVRRTATAQLIGPVAGAEVEQEGAAGVGDIGGVVHAAGHPRDQVGVDGADRVAAGLDQGPRVRLVLAQPQQLGAGEVRVEAQPGQLRHPLLMALVPEPTADVGGTTVLPDDRPPWRAERLAIPQQDRLALVGDAHAPELSGVDLTQGVARGLQCCLPDLLGRVLDPARLWEVLGELLVALGRDPAVGTDHDRGDAGGPGVDGKDAHRSAQAPPRWTMSSTCWSIHARSSATRIS